MRDVGVEIWKDIPGYSRYQVSSFGRVRSLPIDDILYNMPRRDGKLHTEVWHRKGKILTPLCITRSNRCYSQVRLYKNRKRKSVNVAILTMWVFSHPEISTYDEFKYTYRVMYIDGNPNNVACSNLMLRLRSK